MPQFKDSEGVVWQVNITLGDVRRIRNLTGIDLLNAENPLEIYGSLIVRFECVYLLCKDQADQIGIGSFDEFATRLLDGVGLDANVAFQEALVAFYHCLRLSAHEAIADESLKAMKEATTGMDKLAKDIRSAIKNSRPKLPGKPKRKGTGKTH